MRTLCAMLRVQGRVDIALSTITTSTQNHQHTGSHLMSNVPFSLRFFIFRLIVGGFLLSGLSVMQSYAAPSISDYGLLPEIEKMAISPNGELIAYRKVNSDGDFVHVISLKESKAVTGLDVSQVQPRYIDFLNNDKLFLKASDYMRVANFRGRFDVSTGFIMDLNDSGRTRQMLTPGDGVVYPGQTGLGRVIGISPDGKYAYMPAFMGDVQQVYGMAVDPGYALLKVKLSGRGKPKVHKRGTSDTIDFFVGAQGEVLAREDFDDKKNLHTVLAYSDKKWKEIFREETSYVTKSFMGLTPDRKYLVMLATNHDTGRDAYFTLALKDGEIAGPLYERADADIDGTITDKQRVVLGLKYSGFTPSYHFFDAAVDKKVKNILAEFPDHSVWLYDWTPDWKNIVVKVEGTSAPGDFYLYSDAGARYLATTRPNIGNDDMNPLGTVTFKARDGRRIPILLTIPRSKVSSMKNLPAIVMPHGGPASYDTIGFDYKAQAFAQQGYMVIMPQFRGSSGFGAEHELAGRGEWGRKMQDDLSDALKFMVDKGMVDPQRVCIVGSSYGGYAALAGGAYTPDLYKCVVAINGVTELHAFKSWVSEERGRSSRAVEYWEEQFGGEKYTKAGAKEVSPATSAETFTAPVLLVHGKNDKVVPISQSVLMYKALKKARKSVEFIKLDGEDHHMSESVTRLQTLDASIKFVNQYIGG